MSNQYPIAKTSDHRPTAIGCYGDLNKPLGEVLETLITVGDVLELEALDYSETQQNHEILLYSAPPQFVPLAPNRFLLLGIVPDDLLPEEISSAIEYRDCLRLLSGSQYEDLEEHLIDLGIFKVLAKTWLKAPSKKSPDAYLKGFANRLDDTGQAGTISELKILDPEKPSNNYMRRWTEPRNLNGRFVARRGRTYGADLWSYIELEDGRPLRLVDLPYGKTNERGCDQAWRLQAAIDSVNGQPQQLRISPSNGSKVSLDFFSPIPKWLERRLDAHADRSKPRSGCLISYRISANEEQKVIKFAEARMWLEVSKSSE